MSRVREFHQAFDHPLPESPTVLTVERARLRLRLIKEEFKEVDEEFTALLGLLRMKDQLGKASGVETALHECMQRLMKELTDLVYVCEGAQLESGVDPDTAMDVVHESNMSKLGEDGKPMTDAGGKTMKGPNYRPVDPNMLFPGIVDIAEEDIHAQV